MPSVDLSGVTDYASFEAVYDSLLEVVLAAITDDHRTFTESTGEYSATFEPVSYTHLTLPTNREV